MASNLVAGLTKPPVRLRMISADFLCTRSMEVEWEDGTGVRQTWTSWTDELESSWFEAVKLLPSRATAISVSFKVHGPGGPWDICGVDRHKKCEWTFSHDGKPQPEVIWLRTGMEDTFNRIDVVFELSGPVHGCYVSRAINTAREGPPEWWECWTDKKSRPLPEERAATLDAADGAAPLVGLGEPRLYYKCTAKRMCAALHVLLDIHRDTIFGLRELDARFTGQWVGVNSANTVSAGMGIAAAVLLFTVPPVGVGLGIGSAITGGVAWAGDLAADHAHFAGLRKQVSKDAWNAFAVTELIKQWMDAQEALGASNSAAGLMQCFGSGMRGPQTAAARVEELVGRPVDNVIVAAGVSQGTAQTATRFAERVANVGSGIGVASQVFGVASALVSTGIAIRGWSSTKSGQHAVRDQMSVIGLRIRQIEHLLATVDRLECPICADNITLMDDVRHCKDGHHCFHEQCLQQREVCPCCYCSLEQHAESMVDSVPNFQRKLLPQPSAKELIAREVLRMHQKALGMQRTAERAIASSVAQHIQGYRGLQARPMLTEGSPAGGGSRAGTGSRGGAGSSSSAWSSI